MIILLSNLLKAFGSLEAFVPLTGIESYLIWHFGFCLKKVCFGSCSIEKNLKLLEMSFQQIEICLNLWKSRSIGKGSDWFAMSLEVIEMN